LKIKLEIKTSITVVKAHYQLNYISAEGCITKYILKKQQKNKKNKKKTGK